MEIRDKVIVRFSRNNVFEFTDGVLQIECILLNIPGGPGDHWHFEYNGIKFTMNPLSEALVGVVTEKEM